MAWQAFLLPLAAMAGGQVLQARAQNKARSNAAAILEAARRRADEQQQKGIELVKKSAQESFDPKDRLERYDETKEGIITDLGQHLEAAPGAMGEASKASAGRVSDVYDTSRARSVAGNAERALMMARLFGGARAAGDMQLDDAIRSSEMGTQADQMFRVGRKSFNAAIPHADAVANSPNQLQMMAGSVLSGLGQGMAAGELSSLFSPKAPSKYKTGFSDKLARTF